MYVNIGQYVPTQMFMKKTKCICGLFPNRRHLADFTLKRVKDKKHKVISVKLHRMVGIISTIIQCNTHIIYVFGTKLVHYSKFGFIFFLGVIRTYSHYPHSLMGKRPKMNIEVYYRQLSLQMNWYPWCHGLFQNMYEHFGLYKFLYMN